MQIIVSSAPYITSQLITLIFILHLHNYKFASPGRDDVRGIDWGRQQPSDEIEFMRSRGSYSMTIRVRLDS